VGQRRQRGHQIRAVSAHLDAQRALSGSRQHARAQKWRGCVRQAQALEPAAASTMASYWPSSSLRRRVSRLPRSGSMLQVGPQRRSSTTRRRLEVPTTAPCGRSSSGHGGWTPGVARVLALHHAGQGKAFGQLHGHVLERMHGDVGAALFQRHFQLLDKQALAAHLAQRCGPGSGRPGGHAQQLDGVARCSQQGLHMLGLPQGQAAFAGGDDDVAQSRNLFVMLWGVDASMQRCQKIEAVRGTFPSGKDQPPIAQAHAARQRTPLVEDIRLLGRILGDVIREQEGRGRL
jgi:hypothetical protein